MQIPQKLPQFNDETALLLVAGEHHAELYHAHGGELQNDGGVRVDNPHFSDNEGFFMRRGRGVSTSGSVREIRKQDVQQSFAKELKKKIKDVAENCHATTVYLFSPSHVQQLIKSALPRELQTHIRREVVGNFVRLAPLKILEKTRRVVPA